MTGTCIPFGVYPNRRISLRMARKYAPWIALAYAVLDRADLAEEILTHLHELRMKNKHHIGPRPTNRKPAARGSLQQLHKFISAKARAVFRR